MNTAHNKVFNINGDRMSVNLPDPLTASDTDLQNFPYFPFDAVKFRDSKFSATVDPASGFYAVMLWAAAWHQVPAASLPDDDVLLAKLAGFGRFVDEWKKVKEGALYGFIKCSDGRLYHPHLAEHANKAWAKSRKAKESVAKRWEKQAPEEQSLNERESIDDPVQYERITTADTNVIQREERKESKENNTPYSPPNEKTSNGPKNNSAQSHDFAESVNSAFESVWQSMPLRKVSKESARKAWNKIFLNHKKPNPEKLANGVTTITEDLQEKARHLTAENGVYDNPFWKLHFATYLNQQRWTDEELPARGKIIKGGNV